MFSLFDHFYYFFFFLSFLSKILERNRNKLWKQRDGENKGKDPTSNFSWKRFLWLNDLNSLFPNEETTKTIWILCSWKCTKKDVKKWLTVSRDWGC
jgi:hypothetical protein